MSRVEEGASHSRSDGHGSVVPHTHEMLQAGDSIGVGVDRLDRWLSLASAFLVYIFGVPLLDVGRVTQHRRAQVSRGKGAVDRATEPTAHQVGDVAGVVNVSVR